MNGPSPATYAPPGAATADMRGRVCVVTGATRGIGRATAVGLARLGAEVVILGRDEEGLEQVRADTRRVTGSDRVASVRADFASLDSVRRAAAEIVQRWPAVHALVNNAGINSRSRARSVDGYELTFAVNHLAPFLLTNLLQPSLERGAPSRIVNVVSVFAHLGRIDLGDPRFERRRYDPTRAYNQSKLANVMFTLDLADRLRDTGVTANCVSPGLVATDLMREHWWFTTPLLRPVWRRLLLSPEQAAERVVRVAISPTLAGVSGRLFATSERPAAVPRRARDPEARRRLWEISARLAGNAARAPTAGER